MVEEKEKKVKTLIEMIEQETLSDYEGHGCQKRLIPMIKEIFNNTKIIIEQLEEGADFMNIQISTRILSEFVHYIPKYKVISDEEMECIEKIFDELQKLQYEAYLNRKNEQASARISEKITCLINIMELNRTSKVFENFESIWMIFHEINTNWEELVQRGFNTKVFSDFISAIKYIEKSGKPKSEMEKIYLLDEILIGRLGFQPQYEVKAVSYKIVPCDIINYSEKNKETLFSTINTEFSFGYNLKSK